MSDKVKEIVDVHIKCTNVLESGKRETFELVKSKVDSWSMNSNRYRGGLVVTTVTFKEKASPDHEMDSSLPDYEGAKRLWLDALDDMLEDMCRDEPYTRQSLIAGLRAAAEEKR